jgi:hypothetical protein
MYSHRVIFIMRSILYKATIVCLLAAGGCRTPLAGRLVLPDQNTVVREQLAVHSDFALPSHHRLLDELVALRVDLNRRLALPNSDEPIHVYLFESADRFKGFMKIYHPDFPDRRAFFLETDTKLSVYTQWGDRIAVDLRHEIAHGYLHSLLPDIPLWLDEGLAKFYEAPRSERGLNRPLFSLLAERMRRERWRPDLKRLEQLDPAKDMSLDDYAESWAWVYFLLESRPECADILRAYVFDLRRNGICAGFYERLTAATPDPNAALNDFLLAMATKPIL